MTRYTYKDNAVGKLQTGISSSDMTLVLQSGQGSLFGSPSANKQLEITVTKYSIPTDSTSAPVYFEKIEVDNVTTDTFTITERGVGDTTAHDFDAGDYVQIRMTENFPEGLYSEMDDIGGGWFNSAETWTYASATSFTITGDKTDKYQKGDKVKFNQATDGTKYMYIIDVSHSGGTTTIVVTGGDDYDLDNEVITNNYYSKYQNPQGFPDIFTFTPTLTGFSSEGTNSMRFSLEGNKCLVYFGHSGTSNSTDFAATLPIQAGATPFTIYGVVSVLRNGGSNQDETGQLGIGSEDTEVIYYPSFAGSWTASGSKFVYGQFTYII